MRVSRSYAVVGALSILVFGILVVFAAQLSANQTKESRDAKTAIDQRGQLAAALIKSLFDSTQQSIPTYTKQYGGAHIDTAALNNASQQSAFAAIMDQSGTSLAGTAGFTAEAQALVVQSLAWKGATSGSPYILGDFAPFGNEGVVPFVVGFPADRKTVRYFVTGVKPNTLSQFLTGELRSLPGVKGSTSYLLDSRGTVVASSGPATVGKPVGDPHVPASSTQKTGTMHGYYYDQIPLGGSTWRLVQTAPANEVFAATRGARLLVPWLVVTAFGLAAVVAILFGVRAARAAERVKRAGGELAAANAALSRANESLERRAQELERSNEELDQFAFIASHDLQEPLRKVRTFTEQALVLDGSNMSDKARDYLERSNLAAERMQQLISDLLAFARVSTRGRPFEPVDLASVARDVIDDLEPMISSSGGKVNLGELPTINADRTQMVQLLQNLVANALKFRREDVPPIVSISSVRHGDEVDLTVADNGIGFDPQYSQRIFRVFERLHGRSEYPGTGIGLALCRKIVERHGGRIAAKGTPGEGSVFTATLPTQQRDEVILIHHDEPFHEAELAAREDVHV